MESQEYLNQISAKPAVPKKEGGVSGFLRSKIGLAIIVGIVLLILLAIVGAVLGSGKGGTESNAVRLQLHLDNTAAVISEYQPKVKSSRLRSYSASLSTVLAGTSVKLTSYLDEKYDYKKNKDDKKLTEQMKTEQDKLNSELFEAKINGILDRIYAHKMAYEISMFINEETDLYNKTRDDSLKAILDESYNSLKNLYNDFNDFSEG